MKNFFKYTLAGILAIFISAFIMLIVSVGIIQIAVSGAEKEIEVKDKSILVLNLDNEIVDRHTESPFDNISLPGMPSMARTGLNEILNTIYKAKKDARIKGIFLNLSSLNAGLATIREIRNALEEYKDSSNFVIAYSDSYSQGSYYLASAADEIYLQPVGSVSFSGLSANIMFYTGILEKIGIEPQIIRHGKFKSAVEPFMYKKMSEENRLQTSTYVNSLWETILNDISASKNISTEKLQSIADNLVELNAKEAIENGLINKTMYRDEIVEYLKEKTGIEAKDDLRTLSLKEYKNVPETGKTKLSRNKIAVIYAEGTIVTGESSDGNMGSETILKAFREARKDSSVKAIVFRVNSPGGSALASDIMWNEVKLAQQVKPVVVSMGNYAASGGYYIACAADSIFADPATITGSIGVFGLMFNAQELFNKKLDIHFDGVKTAKHADMGSLDKSLTEEQKAIIQKSIEDIYETFISHVADGRGITKEQVDEIGQGRVWSGKNALDIKLIDAFGGLKRATASAAAMAKISEEYRIIEYPKVKTPIEQIMADLSGETSIKLPFMDNAIGKAYFEVIQLLQNYEGPLTLMPEKLIIE